MKYYVYTLSHNGMVFYLGKGSGRRISFYYLKKLRYGDIDEYKGWKFIKMENED